MAYPINPVLSGGLQRRQQQRRARADVLSDGNPVLTGLRITTGSVNVSGQQSPRRTCTLTAVDEGGALVVAGADDVLAPYGNEIAVRRGLMIGGVEYLAPVGVFGIDKASTTWNGGAVLINCNGSDRSAVVARDKFASYVTIPAGVRVTDAIMQLVSGSLSDSQAYSFAPLTQTVSTQVYAPGDDRWAAAVKLAEAVGCLLYFDAAGVLTLTPVPDPASTPPAWTFAPGDLSLLTSVTNSLDRTTAANVIVAMNSGTTIDAPSFAVAQDNDPSSPTFVGGPFGRQVATVSTNLPLSQAALQTYANSQLLLNLGATQQATLSSICLPHLDAFDVIASAVPQVGMDAAYVIDQLALPLGSGLMSLTTRGIVV